MLAGGRAVVHVLVARLRRSSACIALGPPRTVDGSEVVMGSDRITLTVEEAGARLGISRTLAYELVRRGDIPSIRLGRRVLVPIRALELMVESVASETSG
jgi:excisionase family DNA binding protein